MPREGKRGSPVRATNHESRVTSTSHESPVTIGFSLVGVLGDYFLKRASGAPSSLTSGWFYIGFAVYASTAFGWVFVMKHLELGPIGVRYSVPTILCPRSIPSPLLLDS